MSARLGKGTNSFISTWATELCITVLYHKTGGVFSDGVKDLGGL